jgi:hypothetical protein
MVQIATTRAQRRNRMTRLNQLQAELEFLERLHALEGKVGAQDETAKPPTHLAIGDSLSKLWDQYNKLSELTPSTVVGDKDPTSQQRPLLRRAFLLYTPHTTSGWILHTLFYMLAILLGFVLFDGVVLATQGFLGGSVTFILFYGIPLGIALFFIQRGARRNAVRSAAQPEVPNA